MLKLLVVKQHGQVILKIPYTEINMISEKKQYPQIKRMEISIPTLLVINKNILC
jgi:hypothetical protein